MKRLLKWRYVIRFRIFGDSTSSNIANKLKAIYFRRRKVRKKRVTVVKI
jgi:hypothetical protein